MREPVGVFQLEEKVCLRHHTQNDAVGVNHGYGTESPTTSRSAICRKPVSALTVTTSRVITSPTVKRCTVIPHNRRDRMRTFARARASRGTVTATPARHRTIRPVAFQCRRRRAVPAESIDPLAPPTGRRVIANAVSVRIFAVPAEFRGAGRIWRCRPDLATAVRTFVVAVPKRHGVGFQTSVRTGAIGPPNRWRWTLLPGIGRSAQ